MLSTRNLLSDPHFIKWMLPSFEHRSKHHEARRLRAIARMKK